MNLKGLHLLLTYRCNYACDHCFVWSGPHAVDRTMTIDEIDEILRQGLELGSVAKAVDQIYFEGGEPFLYHPLLVDAVKHAVDAGFGAGVVSNGFWAGSPAKARKWLYPLLNAGLTELFLSRDDLHGDEEAGRRVDIAVDAAQALELSTVVMVTERPTPKTTGSVMFRGRAAVCLATDAPRQPWQAFTACPFEDLANLARAHVDPFGYVHLCQGIVMGNLFEQSLADLVTAYAPEQHPIVGPLLQGGPAELAARYALPHDEKHVDACHLCYTARRRLRPRFPELLAPGQVYGEVT